MNFSFSDNSTPADCPDARAEQNARNLFGEPAGESCAPSSFLQADGRATLPPDSLFNALGRTGVTLLLLGPALAFCCWLVLTCADFFDVARVGYGLTRPWVDFALRISLAILLPAALVAGLDARRPALLRLREAVRAALISFLCFALLFFIVGGLAAYFASGMNVGLIPEILRRIGPLAACLLLYVSYKLITILLPPPAPVLPPPGSVRFFALIAACLLFTLPMQALAPLSPFGLPSLPVSFYDVRALPQDFFLFASAAWILRYKGLRVFRPIWLALCLIGPISPLLTLSIYPFPWQLFHLGRAAVAVISCICLYTPSARRWLAA